ENERIFRERIVPRTLAGTAQEQPIAVIVSGQTGAGKTAITSLAIAALTARGEPVNKPRHLQAVPPEVRQAWLRR
ncbi:zeta toxin family protein, partial [Streptomyces sp. NPDC094447]|uniref:zeta toxin family protein n=1 Tax=Streptomyces sp. NPDC094447 TaxID=3366062 RepID=UPI0037F5EFAA